MDKECNHDCENCEEICDEKESVIQKLEPNESSSIKKVIGIVSGKGGVGKSFVTSIIASHLTDEGFKVGIIDADITGPSIPKLFGIKNKAGESPLGFIPQRSLKGIDIMSINLLIPDESEPVVWRGPLLSGAVSQFFTDVVWKDIDYLLIDMPPGTADVSLTVFQSLPIDGIVIITSPQDLVSLIVGKSLKMAEKLSVPVLGIVENMSYYVCPECHHNHHPFGVSKLDDICEKYQIDTSVRLPINKDFATASDLGKIEMLQIPEIDPIIKKIDLLLY